MNYCEGMDTSRTLAPLGREFNTALWDKLASACKRVRSVIAACEISHDYNVWEDQMAVWGDLLELREDLTVLFTEMTEQEIALMKGQMQ
jgi:hypothetical protein